MSAHEAANFVLKPLILAGAITAFSTCGFAEDADLGKMNYESSCAACHGQNGKGDGPVSVELRTKPPDLTLIAKRNGGVYFQPMSYTELSMEDERLGLMVRMKCQFGDLFFNAPIPRTLLETAFWQLSPI